MKRKAWPIDSGCRQRTRLKIGRAAALACIAFAAFSSSLPAEPAAEPPRNHSVDMIDSPPYFEPSALEIRVGDTVEWRNNGPEGIHIVSELGQTIYSGDVPIGTSWKHTFNRAGRYEIICGRHFFMRSNITVRNADGSTEPRFEFPYQKAFREFAIPTRNGIPRMIINDKFTDTMWFTVGGGNFYGFEGIPPQNKIAEVDASGRFVEFSTPTPNGDGSKVGVDSLVMDDSGNIWFTERISNRIGKLTPDGEITEYSLPTGEGYALGVDIDKQGNVWFAERYGNRIGWISQNGSITEVEMPLPDSEPRTVFVDSKGLIWYTARVANEIGYYDPKGGTFHQIRIPTDLARPAGIAETSGGDIYFVEMVGNKIGKVAGDRIVEFPLPSPFAAPFKIIADADDNLWFTEVFGNAIGRFDPRTGRIDEFKIPTEDSRPGGIALDDDGNVWFTEQKGNKVAYLDLAELERLTGDDFVASGKKPGRFTAKNAQRQPSAAPAGPSNPGPPRSGADPAGSNVSWSRDTGELALAAPGGSGHTPAASPGNRSGPACCDTREPGDDKRPAANIHDHQWVQEDYLLPTPGGYPANSLAEDGRGRIWFPEMFGNKIGVLDPATGQIDEIPLPVPLSMPSSVAIDSNGNLWFAQFRGNRLGQLNTQTFALREFELPHAAALPSTVTVDEDGLVWLTELARNAILSFDPPTQTFHEYALPRPDSSPLDIKSDGNGRLWITITNQEHSQIAHFERRTETFGLVDLPAPGSSAAGLAINGSKVWITMGDKGEVAAYDTAAQSWNVFPLGQDGAAPFQIAQDAAGRIWITDGGGFGTDGANQIAVLNPAARTFDNLPMRNSRAKPSGILASRAGDIWFTQKGTNTVSRFYRR